MDGQGEWQRFTSWILPPYMRRSPKVAEALPVFYLRGLSTGDFSGALPILLEEDAAGLSASNIARLTVVWEQDYKQFRHRFFEGCEYVYVWVYGAHFNVCLECASSMVFDITITVTMMRSRRKPPDHIYRSTTLHEAGESLKFVAAGVGINRGSIYRWLKAHHYGGAHPLNAKPIPGAPPKINARQMAKLARIVRDKNPLQSKFEHAL